MKYLTETIAIALFIGAITLGNPVGTFAGGGSEQSSPTVNGAPEAGTFPTRDPDTLWRTDRDFSNAEYLTVGGGCFWCVEAVFDLVPGVIDVVSGYAGGTTVNPTYREVIGGRTGHAEVVQIAYDPGQTNLETLLDIFWRSHDPTTLNRQGPDVGPMYRSTILYTDETQRRIARESLARVDASDLYQRPIVTEVVPLEAFYVAEEYHQDYFARNPDEAYCRVVIAPKIDQLQEDGIIGLLIPEE